MITHLLTPMIQCFRHDPETDDLSLTIAYDKLTSSPAGTEVLGHRGTYDEKAVGCQGCLDWLKQQRSVFPQPHPFWLPEEFLDTRKKRYWRSINLGGGRSIGYAPRADDYQDETARDETTRRES